MRDMDDVAWSLNEGRSSRRWAQVMEIAACVHFSWAAGVRGQEPPLLPPHELKHERRAVVVHGVRVALDHGTEDPKAIGAAQGLDPV